MTSEASDPTLEISKSAIRVAEELDARVVLYSGPIDDHGYGTLIEVLGAASGRQRKNLLAGC